VTIEITRPEIEAMIQSRLRKKGSTDAEEIILEALRATEEPRRTGADLIAAIQASPYREIDLEPEREVLPVRDVTL